MTAHTTAESLKAFANQARLTILATLRRKGETSASELTQGVGLSQSATSQHLAILRREGLVGTRRESQTIYYHLDETALIATLDGLFDLLILE